MCASQRRVTWASSSFDCCHFHAPPGNRRYCLICLPRIYIHMQTRACTRTGSFPEPRRDKLDTREAVVSRTCRMAVTAEQTVPRLCFDTNTRAPTQTLNSPKVCCRFFTLFVKAPILRTPPVAKWLVYSKLFIFSFFQQKKVCCLFFFFASYILNHIRAKCTAGFTRKRSRFKAFTPLTCFYVQFNTRAFIRFLASMFLSQFLSPSSAVHALPQAIGTELQRPLWGVRALDLC